MSQPANTSKNLPPQVVAALEQIGGDLRIARERRDEALRPWAARMGVSVPTLQRMEAGDPTVGMSVYATAIWLSGKLKDFSQLVAPVRDEQALTLDIVKASRRRKM